ncbi:hypothetical protein N0V84_008047 [Fusarium piperis]|uniref:Amidohydrolase-related domain-containing protein n=1 Tax=Fusarium piperis TaxID=1435070 RepID=A0A9W8W8X8_9HYPO|nr:hypothetical protein N0V84_008047 [Fusarium piperis]
MSHHILIEGATVIVYDEDVDSFKSLPDTSVLISGDTIAAIFPSSEDHSIPDDAERVDAKGKIVSPGFIDTHHHGWQTAYRTIAADSHIAEFFVRYGWAGSCYDDFTPEDVYLGHLVSQYEMLDAGTTSVLEHAMASFDQETSDAYLRGSLETGLRTWFAFAIQDFSRSRKDFPGTLEQINIFHKLRKEPKLADSNVYLGIGYDGWRFSSETTNAVVDLIRSGDVAVVTSHFSGPYYTMSTLGRLDNLGAFDNSETPFVLSHASFDVFDETQIMRSKDVYISTTPLSEQLWGTDLTPTAYNLDQTALGVDNPWSCAADMPGQARLYLHRVREQFFNKVTHNRHLPSTTPMTVEQAFHLMTRSGGLAFRRDDIGVLRVGAKADLLIFDGDSYNMLGWSDPIAAIVMHSHPGDIEAVMVGGQWRKRDGKLTLPDGATSIDEIKARFLESARRLQGKVLSQPRPTFEGSFMPGLEYETPYLVSLNKRK